MTKTSQILITGCPRSGASMIAATIHHCGAFGGDMIVKHSERRGMYENIKIRDRIVKPFLKQFGADTEGQYPLLPGLDKIVAPKRWKHDLEAILSDEGFKGGSWMYKDSRSALLWEIWDQIYPDAKWVIVRRQTGFVIDSCVKTAFMKAFKNPANLRKLRFKKEEEGWLWLVHQYEAKFIDMINSGLNCKVIWPERVTRKDYRQVKELIEWLGLSWQDDSEQFIESLLVGTKQKKKGVSHGSKGNS